MDFKERSLQLILDQGMLPLFFYKDPEVSLKVVETLYKAGLRSLEYTNRGKEALSNFKFLRSKIETSCPGMELGVGTVKTADEAKAFIDAGAQYLVAPIINREVGELATAAGLLWIPGCMTPTEINAAQQAGAILIKIFPANILGPEFLSSIRELFQGQLFIPTGGVEIEKENIKKWFDAGVCAVGMGSKMISKQALETGDYDGIYKLALKAIKVINEVKHEL